MNYRQLCIDIVITIAILWIFLYWMPTKIGSYFQRMPESKQIEFDEIDYDVEWDIEEIENVADYIDDYDVWDYK